MPSSEAVSGPKDVVMDDTPFRRARSPSQPALSSASADVPQLNLQEDVQMNPITSEPRSHLQSPIALLKQNPMHSRAASPSNPRSPPSTSHAQLADILSKVYATNETLREDVAQLRADRAQLQEENTRLQRETPQTEFLRREASDLRQQVARLTSEVDRLRTENAALQQESSRERTRADKAARLVDVFEAVANAPGSNVNSPREKSKTPNGSTTIPKPHPPPTSNSTEQLNHANALTSSALRTILECETRATNAEKQRDDQLDRVKLLEQQRDDAIARVEQRFEQIVAGRDDIIAHRDEALARAEGERIQTIIQRDEAEARRTALTTAWGELQRYLELADLRTRDARAGFTRIVAEGGGRLVVLPLGGLNENGDVAVNGQPEPNTPAEIDHFRQLVSRSNDPDEDRYRRVQVTNGSGDLTRSMLPPTRSPNLMPQYLSPQRHHSSHLSVPRASSRSTTTLVGSSGGSFSQFPIGTPHSSRPTASSGGMSGSYEQGRVRPRSDSFDDGGRPAKKSRSEREARRESSRHDQRRDGETQGNMDGDIRIHSDRESGDPRDEFWQREQRARDRGRREVDNRSGRGSRAMFTESPMPSPRVANTTAPPTQPGHPHPLSQTDIRPVNPYPNARSAPLGQPPPEGALSQPRLRRTKHHRSRSGSASSASSTSIDEMILATATKEDDKRSGASGSPPPSDRRPRELAPLDSYQGRSHSSNPQYSPPTAYRGPEGHAQTRLLKPTFARVIDSGQQPMPYASSSSSQMRPFDGPTVQSYQTHVFAPPVTGAPTKKTKGETSWERSAPVLAKVAASTEQAAAAAGPIPSKSFPGVNEKGERACRSCGVAGRYKEGKCIEKWGPGPEGPGTVCDRCRKKMKRVERRGTLESQQLYAPGATLTPQQPYGATPSGRSTHPTQGVQPSSSLPSTLRTLASTGIHRAATSDTPGLQRADNLPYIPTSHAGTSHAGGLGPEGTHLVLQQQQQQQQPQQLSSRMKSARQTTSVLPAVLAPSSGATREDPPESSMRSTQSTHRAITTPAPPLVAAPQAREVEPAGDADADGEADEDAEGEDAELLEAVEAAESKANSAGGGNWMKEEDM